MPENNEPDDVAAGFEIVQKINPARLIQLNLEALNVATTPARAALQVANLYLNLRGIRRIDAEFEAEWNLILGGQFMGYVARDDLRINLTWNAVWAARECLLDLMERRGMSFQAQLEDAVQARRSAAFQRHDALRERLVNGRVTHG